MKCIIRTGYSVHNQETMDYGYSWVNMVAFKPGNSKLTMKWINDDHCYHVHIIQPVEKKQATSDKQLTVTFSISTWWILMGHLALHICVHPSNKHTAYATTCNPKHIKQSSKPMWAVFIASLYHSIESWLVYGDSPLDYVTPNFFRIIPRSKHQPTWRLETRIMC